MGERGSVFQDFSPNINSGINNWGIVTDRLMDKFRFFILLVRPKAFDT